MGRVSIGMYCTGSEVGIVLTYLGYVGEKANKGLRERNVRYKEPRGRTGDAQVGGISFYVGKS